MAIDFAALAARLLSQSPGILYEWFPAGKLHGHEFKVGDVHGSEGESLSINVNTGKWADFAAGLQGGDLISLYAAMEGVSNAEAARKLEGASPRVPAAAPQKAPKKEEWTPIVPVPEGAPKPPDDYYRRRANSQEWDKLTLKARWTYRTPEGQVVGHACRFEWFEPDGSKRKDVVPQVYCSNVEGKRQWRWKALPQPRPLYNLPELRERLDAPVIVVEGEKKVDALRTLAPQYVGVAWAGGAAAWRKSDWSVLKGRSVLLWPDADKQVATEANAAKFGVAVGDRIPRDDQPGIRAMWEIGHMLLKHCPSVKMIIPDDETLPDGWDAADAVADGWDWPKLKAWAIPKVVQLHEGGSNGTAARAAAAEGAAGVVGAVASQSSDQGASRERGAGDQGDARRAPQAGERAEGGSRHDGAGGGDDREGRGHGGVGTGEAGGDARLQARLHGTGRVSPGADQRAARKPAEATASGQVSRWLQWGIERNGNGIPLTNLNNAVRVLEADPSLRGLVWFDEFLARIMTGSPAREWTDSDDIALTLYMQRTIGISKLGKETVSHAVQAVAMANKRNCVREFIESTTWDGTARIEEFLIKVFHCADNAYTRAASRNFWVSLLARVYHPGCKVDNMIVLEGSQGLLKSSVLDAIASPWFAAQHESATNSKAFAEVLSGKLVTEIEELDAFNRAEVNTIKKVVSCRVDRYRASYARYAADHPRQGVMVGTVNKDDWNRDETGARRFWPIRCVGVADIAYVHEHRAQLFAEALVALRAGATWWEMPEAETRTEQRKRYDADPWIGPISEYLIGRAEATVNEIAGGCLKLELREIDKAKQMRISGVLRVLGWVNDGNAKRNGRVVKVWRPGSDQYGETSQVSEVATEVATRQDDIPFQ